jgi:hypothetical protein
MTFYFGKHVKKLQNIIVDFPEDENITKSFSIRPMLNVHENSDLRLVNFTGILLYRIPVPCVAGLIDTPLDFFDLKLFLNEKLFILINQIVWFMDKP